MSKSLPAAGRQMSNECQSSKSKFWWIRKKSKKRENVMLNLVQHLIKSMSYETLKQPMKQVQGVVQGDKSGLFTRLSNFKILTFELWNLALKPFILSESSRTDIQDRVVSPYPSWYLQTLAHLLQSTSQPKVSLGHTLFLTIFSWRAPSSLRRHNCL